MVDSKNLVMEGSYNAAPISVEHVFLGLLDEQTQNTTELFRAFSITKDKFLQQLTACLLYTSRCV